MDTFNQERALPDMPLRGIILADKQTVSRALLASGARISQMNCVRRHLSAIKGGRLVAACHPAHVVTLLICDVPGDDPVDIAASGPVVVNVNDFRALLVGAPARTEKPDAS